MSGTTAVELDDLHMLFQARFGRPVWALRGLSISVEQGTVLGLLGPNGAGKTTTISCLLGLLRPQRGTVRVRGEVIAPGTSLGGCGVLLEDTRLPPFLPVRDALAAAGRLRAIGSAALSAAVDAVVEQTRSGDLLGRDVRALSKGQARRIGLAAALLGDPPLLVLDEPSSGLDPEARVEFDTLVRSLRDGKRTVLIASHLLGDVEATCSHIAVVNHGRVVLEGRAADLLGAARRGQVADIHVDADSSAALDRLGIGHQPSAYPGLVLLQTEREELEVFAALAEARIAPRRVEPKVSVLSLYLQATREPS